MKIAAVSPSQKRAQADLLVIGFFNQEKVSKELAALEPDFAKTAEAALKSGRFEGKFGTVFSSYQTGLREAKEAVLLGLGSRKEFKSKCMRKASSQIVQMAKERKAKTVRIWMPAFSAGAVSLEDAVNLFSETARLTSYRFDKYLSKKEDENKQPVAEFELLLGKTGKPDALKKEIESSASIAQAVITARNLINEPGNEMNPPKLAAFARGLAREKKLRCEILEQAELKKLGMNGILAVNQGSVTPPALIILEYGQRFKSRGTVCLIGKGVTFDTGGISIKPSKDMEKMKYDMSGAAAVIATLGALADLKLPVHVIGLAPAVENNVAKDPQRPGDIIRMYNGKSVEVINTDAEGRLILADALAYAERYKPKAILDIATLTGMARATFDTKAIAVLGTDERLMQRVKRAGEAVGERCWELPMWEEYGDLIKGYHSDLLNVGTGYGGGTITAAKFLEAFVPAKTSWVHLDIAGVAWADSSRFDCPKGATGAGVRLFIEFLKQWK